MNIYACYNCGYPRTEYRQCKILCPNCGFMLDCSDLDVGGEIQRREITNQRRVQQASGSNQQEVG